MECRICSSPLHPVRVELGHTGCSDCEVLHLRNEIAVGVPSGRMPGWWIDPTPWDEQDTKEDMRRLYNALEGGGDPLRDYRIPEGFYGKDWDVDPGWHHQPLYPVQHQDMAKPQQVRTVRRVLGQPGTRPDPRGDR